MAVTVDSAAIVGGGSGITGWSARSTFYVPSIDQHNRSGTVETGFGETLTQSFVAGSNQELTTVWLHLAKNNSPTDDHWITIESDDGSGFPSGSVIATSDILDPSTVAAFPTYGWFAFTFASPPSLTSGSTYHIMPNRDTPDGTHFLWWHFSTTNPYSAGHMSFFNGSVWTVSTIEGFDFYFITVAGERLYQVTQDAELHVWESSDNGSSWAELDAGNGPAVNSSTKPFSADARNDANATGAFSDITCVLFTNTNTIRGWDFNFDTRLWDTTALQNADASTDADFNRNVRVIARASETVLFYTSVADDADLEYVRRTTSTWGSQTQTLALSDAEASSYSDVIKDDGGFAQMWWYNCNANDFDVRSLTGTTLGTDTDVDNSAADVETEQASGVFAVYDDGGTDKAIIAYIDSDGNLQERVCSLGVTSASITQGTQHEIDDVTSYAGRALTSCEINGNLYVFASTATNIDYYVDTGATGTWSAQTNWITSLTNAVVSTAVPIEDVGILVSYVHNGNVLVELLVFDVTVNGSLATASALARVGSIFNDVTGSLGTASALANAGTVSIDYRASGSLATATALARVGSIKNTVTGSLSAASALANTGDIFNTLTGSRALASALANVGTYKAGNTMQGNHATASALANAGVSATDIHGSLGTATAEGFAADIFIDVTGNLATASALGRAGSLKNTVTGSLGAATGTANAGDIQVDITGSLATADGEAFAGDALTGFTVLGSLATASAQAFAGTAEEGGQDNDADRRRFFQVRPLPTGT
jgi:hypothetical protein